MRRSWRARRRPPGRPSCRWAAMASRDARRARFAARRRWASCRAGAERLRARDRDSAGQRAACRVLLDRRAQTLDLGEANGRPSPASPRPDTTPRRTGSRTRPGWCAATWSTRTPRSALWRPGSRPASPCAWTAREHRFEGYTLAAPTRLLRRRACTWRPTRTRRRPARGRVRSSELETAVHG